MAVWSIDGYICGGQDSYPWTSKGLAHTALKLAQDPTIKVVALRMNSNGGDASIISDISEAFAVLRASKPVYAMVSMACSGGYLIASHAHRIYISDCGVAGSLGVAYGAVDESKWAEKQGYRGINASTQDLKASGSFLTPISPDAEASMKAQALALERPFMACIAANLGTTPDALAALRGDVFIGADAVKRGLAHGVTTLGGFLEAVESAAAAVSGGSSTFQSAAIAAPKAQGAARIAGPARVTPDKGPLVMKSKIKSKKSAPQVKASGKAIERANASMKAKLAAAIEEDEETDQAMTAAELREKYPDAVKEIEEGAVAAASEAPEDEADDAEAEDATENEAEAEDDADDAEAEDEATASNDDAAGEAAGQKPAATTKAPATVQQLIKIAAKLPTEERNAFVVAQQIAAHSVGQARVAYTQLLEKRVLGGEVGQQKPTASTTSKGGVTVKVTTPLKVTPSGSGPKIGDYEAKVIAHVKEHKCKLPVAMAKIAETDKASYADWEKRKRPSIQLA